MKQTDYCPRAAFMDTLLTGNDLIGAEIGVDVGAHAEALLTYCNIKELHLIDVWEKEYCHGYCIGRLLKFRTKVFDHKQFSFVASQLFNDETFDFIYLDQLHDYDSVKMDLNLWFPKLKKSGIIGHRNYTTCQKAIDEFVASNKIKTQTDRYHNEIILFK